MEALIFLKKSLKGAMVARQKVIDNYATDSLRRLAVDQAANGISSSLESELRAAYSNGVGGTSTEMTERNE